MMKMAWERDEASFMRVEPVVRSAPPASSTPNKSSRVCAGSSFMPVITMSPDAVSLMAIAC